MLAETHEKCSQLMRRMSEGLHASKSTNAHEESNYAIDQRGYAIVNGRGGKGRTPEVKGLREASGWRRDRSSGPVEGKVEAHICPLISTIL
jgi:hypothetical protein